MREKKIIFSISFAIFVLVNTATTVFAETLPLQEYLPRVAWGLESLGLQITNELPDAVSSPEEAILFFNLPQVYILPDSPFYFLKKIWEGAQILFASSPNERGEILLELAEKRLSEGIALIKKGDWKGASSVLQKYQGQFENAQNMLALIRDLQKYDTLRQQISRELQNQALLASFLEKIGAGEVMGEFEPRMPIGGLELRMVE